MERQTGFSISLSPETLEKLNAIKHEAQRREIEDEDLEMWETCKEHVETRAENLGTRGNPFWLSQFPILVQEIDRNGIPVEDGNHVPAQVVLLPMGPRYGDCIDVRVAPATHGPRLPFNTGGSLRVYPGGHTMIHEGWEQGERSPRPYEHTWWKGVVDLVRQDLIAGRPAVPAS